MQSYKKIEYERCFHEEKHSKWGIKSGSDAALTLSEWNRGTCHTNKRLALIPEASFVWI